MERYDFRDDSTNDILSEVEELNRRQRQAAHEAIKQIREETEAETILQNNQWFDSSILPALRTYAELTFSILDIERDRKEIIQATLRNSSGLEITESCRSLYMALIMAVQIFVDVEDGDPVLILTYDCRKFIN